MTTGNDDGVETLVAFVSGALIGAAATLLYVRARHNRALASRVSDDDYHYDGGDLFV